MIQNMASGHIRGQMVENMKGIGQTANKTERESFTVKDKSKREFGRMENF